MYDSESDEDDGDDSCQRSRSEDRGPGHEGRTIDAFFHFFALTLCPPDWEEPHQPTEEDGRTHVEAEKHSDAHGKSRRSPGLSLRMVFEEAEDHPDETRDAKSPPYPSTDHYL